MRTGQCQHPLAAGWVAGPVTPPGAAIGDGVWQRPAPGFDYTRVGAVSSHLPPIDDETSSSPDDARSCLESRGDALSGFGRDFEATAPGKNRTCARGLGSACSSAQPCGVRGLRASVRASRAWSPPSPRIAFNATGPRRGHSHTSRASDGVLRLSDVTKACAACPPKGDGPLRKELTSFAHRACEYLYAHSNRSARRKGMTRDAQADVRSSRTRRACYGWAGRGEGTGDEEHQVGHGHVHGRDRDAYRQGQDVHDLRR